VRAGSDDSSASASGRDREAPDVVSSVTMLSRGSTSMPPSHQSLQQVVLQLGTFFLGQLTRSTSLIDAFELSTNASGIVVLLLGLLTDLLSQPHHSPHGREWQTEQTRQQSHHAPVSTASDATKS
jgi:hypothetical protein